MVQDAIADLLVMSTSRLALPSPTVEEMPSDAPKFLVNGILTGIDPSLIFLIFLIAYYFVAGICAYFSRGRARTTAAIVIHKRTTNKLVGTSQYSQSVRFSYDKCVYSSHVIL